MSVSRLGGLVAVVLLLAGCSRQYQAERWYWQAEQAAAPVLQSPDRAPAEQVAKAQAAYAVVVRRAPGTIWAARAQGRIASLYVLQQNYDAAREAYAQLISASGNYAQLSLWARQALARTYEFQDRWPEAVRAYEEFMDAAPWTQAALEMPLYIARGYEQRGQQEKATEAYRTAVHRYQQWIPKAPTPPHVTMVKHYLANAHQRLQQWPEAVAVLQELAEVTEDAHRPLTLAALGAIYQEKLNAPDQARAAYARLIESYPQHPLAQVARQQLERAAP